MCSLIIWLIFVTFHVVSTHGAQEIRIKIEDTNRPTFTLLNNEPFRIVIENGRICKIWCQDYVHNQYKNNADLLPQTEFKDCRGEVLSFTMATSEMSTLWSCTILQEYHGGKITYDSSKTYTTEQLLFIVHVKGSKPINLIANDKHLQLSLGGLDVEYDGVNNYSYVDGQVVDLVCKKHEEDYDKTELDLEYYDAEGVPLFQSTILDGIVKHNFRVRLKSKNNKYYIDCIHKASQVKYRYRTLFILDDNADARDLGIAVTVNNLQLVQYDNETDFVNYHYKFVEGEILIITCRKTRKYLNGILGFYSDVPNIGRYTESKDLTENLTMTLNTMEMTIHRKSVVCSISDAGKHIMNHKITFFSDVPETGVRIVGLPASNILYQHTDSSNGWNINYQYTVNETLNLRCVGKGRLHGNSFAFEWKIKNKDKLYTSYQKDGDTEPNKNSNFNEITLTESSDDLKLTLDESHNGTTIKCDARDKSVQVQVVKYVKIVLYLQPEYTTKYEISGYSQSEKEIPVVIVALSIGIPIAVIIIISLVCWHTRQKHTNVIQKRYQHFSNQNLSESQMEVYDDSHYTKIDESVLRKNFMYTRATDKCYAVPFARQSNVPSENHYTEIDDDDYIKLQNGLNCRAVQPSNNGAKNRDIDSRNFNRNNGGYDTLKHCYLAENDDKQTCNKLKNVTFKNDFGINADTPSKAGQSSKFKGVAKKPYANDVGLKLNKQVRNNYENDFVPKEIKSLEYSEPYGEFERICENDCYMAVK